MKKRLISLTLVLAMVLTLLPMCALAVAHPVTRHQITLSDVIVSNEYENMYDELETGNEIDKTFYSLGMIGLWSEEDSAWGYQNFWSYLVPSDATITFHLTENTKDFYLEGYTLEEVDSVLPGIKTWNATCSGTDAATAKTAHDVTMTLSEIREYIPEFDFLVCSIGGEEWVELMFVDQPSENSTPAASTQTTPSFTDVAATSPFAPAISWAVEKGITNGTTPNSFSPGNTCSRGNILTFLWRSQGSPEPTISNPYKDEIPSAFQKAAIWAHEKGLVTGNTFASTTPCTRSSSVTYMWKLAGKPEAKAASFKDVATTSEYAKAINWAVEKGITNGTGDGTAFSPDAICTRGQIVTFLYRNYAK